MSCSRMPRYVAESPSAKSRAHGFVQFGKPMYSTRIILGDLNPVWEETAVMLLTMDEVRSKEDLSAMLWDSDKRSAE